MMPADLMTSPRYLAEQLGLPLPDDPHAVSACLPLWEHNIGYEEGDAAVHDALQASYPRFRLHPSVQRLCDHAINSGQRMGLPFAGPEAANRAIQYVRHHGAQSLEQYTLTNDLTGPIAVTVEAADYNLLKQYWQHAGENLSSRAAELVLNRQLVSVTPTAARETVQNRLAEWHSVDPGRIFLFPTGMAAIATAWRSVQQISPGVSCQFGFPYVDTLKIQQRFPDSQHFFLAKGDADDLQALRKRCETNPPTAIFVEIPTNPLLVTPDVEQLRKIADDFGCLLVIDDTLAAITNLRLLPWADLLVTSLTKFFSGSGNVLAGSLIVNPSSRKAVELFDCVTSEFEEQLCDADCEVLESNCSDVADRVSRTNENALALVKFLRQHPAVDRVYYTDQCEVYQRLKTEEGGFGGLLSIDLKNPEKSAPEFYDRLKACKGPNLGTYFTLVCPFTILAHYEELEWAESCGVSRWLIRVSVGNESCGELIQRFDTALDGLHL